MNSKVVEVYTDALFKLSEEKNTIDTTKNDLLYLRKVLDENERLKEILQRPKVSKKDKKEIVGQVFSNIQPDTLNFVKILLDKTRFFYFNDIVDSFVSKYYEKEGISIGTLTSAREMEEEDINLIKESLSKKFGKKVELNYKLDPSLIGGFQVKLDGKMIDNSLKSRLNNLKSSLKEKR